MLSVNYKVTSKIISSNEPEFITPFCIELQSEILKIRKRFSFQGIFVILVCSSIFWHKSFIRHSLNHLILFCEKVSRLVIIHEEGEAGHEMPDLTRPVDGVSKAVNNLVKVNTNSHLYCYIIGYV